MDQPAQSRRARFHGVQRRGGVQHESRNDDINSVEQHGFDHRIEHNATRA
jgi:hypothetical protein